MKMDLKHFKKLHSNENSTTFMDKNGHEIRVAHKALNDEMKKALDELPKFAKGGTVGLHADYSQYDQDQKKIKAQESYTGKSAEISAKERKKLEKSVSSKLGGRAVDLRLPTGMADGGEVEEQDEFGLSLPENTMMGNAGMNQSVQPDYSQMMSPMSPEQANSEQPEQLQNVQIPQQQQAPMQQQMPQSQDSSKYMRQMEQGMRAEADSMGQQATQQAQAAEEHAQKQQQLIQHYDEVSKQIDNERMAAYEDLKQGHIDPNHYLNSMDGFGQAMSAIGLILGGLGGGMAGTENQALAFLNKQIDRDVEAQKAMLGKKENLVTILDRQMGNLKDATIMAKAMQSDMYATKLQQIADRSKNPQVQAKAMQMIAQMHMTYEPQIQEMKQRQAAMGAMKNGVLDPAQAINLLVPKEDRKQATEELGKHQMAQKSLKMVNDTLDKAFKINSAGNRIANPIQSREQLKAMEVNLLGVLKPIFNNFSETDKEQALANMPALTDNQQTLANKKQNMENLIRVNLSTPTLDRYKIKLPESKQNKFTPR